MKVVGQLAGYFPVMKLPEATIRLWAAELRPYGYEAACVAVRDLARTSERPPALAALLGRIRPPSVALPATPRPPVDKDINREGLERARRMLGGIGNYGKEAT